MEPLGFGVVCTVQVLPSQRSASVRDASAEV